MKITIRDIKTERPEFYPGDTSIQLTINGHPIENLYRKSYGYESDTFSGYYKTLTEAKQKWIERFKNDSGIYWTPYYEKVLGK